MTKSSKILLVVVTLIVVALVSAVALSNSLFIQLLIALALAYLLNPAVMFLERKGLGRTYGVLIVFAGAVAAALCGVLFLIMSIGGELSSIQINLPGYAQHLYQLIPATIKSYLGIGTPENLTLKLGELIQGARAAAPGLIKPLFLFFRQAFSSSIGLILAVLGYGIIPVYLFYLLVDLPRLKAAVLSLVPVRFQSGCTAKMVEIDTILSGFIRGQLSVCGILAVLYSLGLYFIGIDLAIVIGMLAGIMFIIPYVGTILGIVLSVGMALLKFHDLLHPLLCLGWFVLVQALEGVVITPKIVGDTVGLHPLVALVALLLGGQLFGVLGMLVAVPLTAILQVFLHSLIAYYRESEFYSGGEW